MSKCFDVFTGRWVLCALCSRVSVIGSNLDISGSLPLEGSQTPTSKTSLQFFAKTRNALFSYEIIFTFLSGYLAQSNLWCCEFHNVKYMGEYYGNWQAVLDCCTFRWLKRPLVVTVHSLQGCFAKSKNVMQYLKLNMHGRILACCILRSSCCQ